VLWTHRQHHGIVGSRSLQLEIEIHAEALTQRQPEAAIDAPAERRVYDELHAAGVVEEALEDDVAVGRHDAQGGVFRSDVVDDLLRSRRVERTFAL
jgi:hypothetical protein